MRIIGENGIENNDDGFIIKPGDSIMVGTGLSVYIENPSLAGIVIPRSSMGKRNMMLSNTVGLIDSSYQGEILLNIRNMSFDNNLHIDFAERIAQLVIMSIFIPSIDVVSDFNNITLRGSGGFGSTNDFLAS